MYGIYANIGGILMVNVTIYIYSIHGSYGYVKTSLFSLTDEVTHPVARSSSPTSTARWRSTREAAAVASEAPGIC